MATATESTTAEELVAPARESECSVCHEEFTDPKLLPCGHLLCRHCLLAWLQSQPGAACPLCRYRIVKDLGDQQPVPSDVGTKGETDTEGGQGQSKADSSKLEALVDGFPTDLAMAALTEANRLLGRKNGKCVVCEDVEATSVCLQCGNLLCGPCKKAHGRLKATRHHVVEDLSSLTADRLADFQLPTPCTQHPEEPCRLFCPQHDTPICQLCATSRHRGCTEVKEMQQQAEEATKVQGDLLEKLSSREKELEEALAELEHHLADTEKQTEAMLAEIQTVKDRLITAVNTWSQRLQLETSEVQSQVRVAVKEAKALLLGRQSRLGSHKAVGQRALQSMVPDVVCGMTSVMNERVNDPDRQVTLPKAAKVITTAKLLMDENVLCKVEKDLATLGKVEVEHARIAANVLDMYRFHDSHGANIVLTNNRKTAKWTTGISDGIVIVGRPMKVMELIQVRIDKYGTYGGTRFGTGVLTESPDTATFDRLSGVMRSSCVVWDSSVLIKTEQSKSQIGRRLADLCVGSRVGVGVDRHYDVHLYIDGQDQGYFASIVAQPCYALFDMNYGTEMTLLP